MTYLVENSEDMCYNSHNFNVYGWDMPAGRDNNVKVPIIDDKPFMEVDIDRRKAYVDGLKGDDLTTFVEECHKWFEAHKEYKMGAFANAQVRKNAAMAKQNLNRLFAQVPYVGPYVCPLDKNLDDEEKMAAVVADIKAGIFPNNRYVDLVHLNCTSPEESVMVVKDAGPAGMSYTVNKNAAGLWVVENSLVNDAADVLYKKKGGAVDEPIYRSTNDGNYYYVKATYKEIAADGNGRVLTKDGEEYYYMDDNDQKVVVDEMMVDEQHEEVAAGDVEEITFPADHKDVKKRVTDNAQKYTFFAYAVQKLNPEQLGALHKNLNAQLSAQEYAKYLGLEIILAGVADPRTGEIIVDGKNVFGLFTVESGLYNKAYVENAKHHHALLKSIKDEVFDPQMQQADAGGNVVEAVHAGPQDAHDAACNKSVGQSYVRLIKRFIAEGNLDPNNKVKFQTRDGRAVNDRYVLPAGDHAVKNALDAKFKDLVKVVEGLNTPEKRFEYYKHTMDERIAKMSYAEAMQDAEFKKRFAYFEEIVALNVRVLKDARDKHKWSYEVYQVPTNSLDDQWAHPSNVTVEQSLALMWFAANDTERLEGNDKEATQKLALIGIMDAVHQAVRGYNIDSNFDSPDRFVYGGGPNRTRCYMGAVNALGGGLVGLHKDVERKTVNPTMIRNSIRQALVECINALSEPNVENSLLDPEVKAEAATWALQGGAIPASARQRILAYYNANKKANLEEDFGDQDFVVQNLLTQLKPTIKLRDAVTITDLRSLQDVFSSIALGKTPIVVDVEGGYETSLAGFVRVLIEADAISLSLTPVEKREYAKKTDEEKVAIKEKAFYGMMCSSLYVDNNDESLKLKLFLAKSLPANHSELTTPAIIGDGVVFTLGDIRALSLANVRTLHESCNDVQNLYKQINTDEQAALLDLYFRKAAAEQHAQAFDYFSSLRIRNHFGPAICEILMQNGFLDYLKIGGAKALKNKLKNQCDAFDKVALIAAIAKKDSKMVVLSFKGHDFTAEELALYKGDIETLFRAGRRGFNNNNHKDFVSENLLHGGAEFLAKCLEREVVYPDEIYGAFSMLRGYNAIVDRKKYLTTLVKLHDLQGADATLLQDYFSYMKRNNNQCFISDLPVILKMLPDNHEILQKNSPLKNITYQDLKGCSVRVLKAALEPQCDIYKISQRYGLSTVAKAQAMALAHKGGLFKDYDYSSTQYLKIAADYGQVEFLKKAYQIKSSTVRELSPALMHAAIRNSMPEVIEYLINEVKVIDAKAIVYHNYKHDGTASAPLLIAYNNNASPETFEKLIEHGADVNLKPGNIHDGWKTLLCKYAHTFASCGGDVKQKARRIFDALLASPNIKIEFADVNDVGEHSELAKHMVEHQNFVVKDCDLEDLITRPQILKLVHEAGKLTDEQYKNTIILKAAVENGMVDILEKAHEKGADFGYNFSYSVLVNGYYIQEYHNLSLLSLAVISNKPAVVKFLLEQGLYEANQEYMSGSNKSHFEFAFEKDVNFYPVIEEFIKAGANVNAKVAGRPLFEAVLAGIYHPDVVLYGNLNYQAQKAKRLALFNTMMDREDLEAQFGGSYSIALGFGCYDIAKRFSLHPKFDLAEYADGCDEDPFKIALLQNDGEWIAALRAKPEYQNLTQAQRAGYIKGNNNLEVIRQFAGPDDRLDEENSRAVLTDVLEQGNAAGAGAKFEYLVENGCMKDCPVLPGAELTFADFKEIAKNDQTISSARRLFEFYKGFKQNPNNKARALRKSFREEGAEHFSKALLQKCTNIPVDVLGEIYNAALAYGNNEVLELLARDPHKFTVNSVDTLGRNALARELVRNNKNMRVIAGCLDRDVDLNFVLKNGHSPLHLLVAAQNFANADKLIALGVKNHPDTVALDLHGIDVTYKELEKVKASQLYARFFEERDGFVDNATASDMMASGAIYKGFSEELRIRFLDRLIELNDHSLDHKIQEILNKELLLNGVSRPHAQINKSIIKKILECKKFLIYPGSQSFASLCDFVNQEKDAELTKLFISRLSKDAFARREVVRLIAGDLEVAKDAFAAIDALSYFPIEKYRAKSQLLHNIAKAKDVRTDDVMRYMLENGAFTYYEGDDIGLIDFRFKRGVAFLAELPKDLQDVVVDGFEISGLRNKQFAEQLSEYALRSDANLNRVNARLKVLEAQRGHDVDLYNFKAQLRGKVINARPAEEAGNLLNENNVQEYVNFNYKAAVFANRDTFVKLIAYINLSDPNIPEATRLSLVNWAHVHAGRVASDMDKKRYAAYRVLREAGHRAISITIDPKDCSVCYGIDDKKKDPIEYINEKVNDRHDRRLFDGLYDGNANQKFCRFLHEKFSWHPFDAEVEFGPDALGEFNNLTLSYDHYKVQPKVYKYAATAIGVVLAVAATAVVGYYVLVPAVMALVRSIKDGGSYFGNFKDVLGENNEWCGTAVGTVIGGVGKGAEYVKNGAVHLYEKMAHKGAEHVPAVMV